MSGSGDGPKHGQDVVDGERLLDLLQVGRQPDDITRVTQEEAQKALLEAFRIGVGTISAGFERGEPALREVGWACVQSALLAAGQYRELFTVTWAAMDRLVDVLKALELPAEARSTLAQYEDGMQLLVYGLNMQDATVQRATTETARQSGREADVEDPTEGVWEEAADALELVAKMVRREGGGTVGWPEATE